VNRWNQDESARAVIVKSYQPLAADVAVASLDQVPSAATRSVSMPDV
jgi:hypothetical protein